MKAEIRSLTGLRGVAAVLVMFYHYNSSRLLTGPAHTFVAHGYLMVDVFFILSGYVIVMTYGNLFANGFSWPSFLKFMGRRVARIYPLYVFMTVPAGLLIANGWMDHWPGPPVFLTALVNLTMLQSLIGVPTLNTPGWSISAEWMVYLIFPLLAMLCLHGAAWRAFAIAVITVVALPLLTQIPSLLGEPKRAGILDIWHYGTVYPVVRSIIEFTMGILAYRASTNATVRRTIGNEWVAAALTIALLVLMCVKAADIAIALLLPSFMIALAAQRSLAAQFLASKPLHWLGELSFSIYMIHDLMIYFIVAFAHWLSEKGVSMYAAMTVGTLLFAGLVIALSQLAYTFLEQPCRRLVRQLFETATGVFGSRHATARP